MKNKILLFIVALFLFGILYNIYLEWKIKNPDIKKTIKDLTELIDKEKHLGALISRAINYHSLNNFEASEKDFTTAFHWIEEKKKKDGFPLSLIDSSLLGDFYRERAGLKRSKKKFLEALNDCIESKKFDQKNTFTDVRMGTIYLELGDTLKACECFKKDLGLSYYHFDKHCK